MLPPPSQPETCYRRLAVGAVVLQDNRVLLVYNRRPSGGGHWSLPKGSCETGEPLVETLRREVQEETGLLVEPGELAFVSEFFVSSRREWYLQHYFHATSIGGTPGVQPKDMDVIAVKWVPFDALSRHIAFRPWLEPLQQWLAERRPRYHLFDRNENKTREREPRRSARFGGGGRGGGSGAGGGAGGGEGGAG